jgi:hypothetical protein
MKTKNMRDLEKHWAEQAKKAAKKQKTQASDPKRAENAEADSKKK